MSPDWFNFSLSEIESQQKFVWEVFEKLKSVAGKSKLLHFDPNKHIYLVYNF